MALSRKVIAEQRTYDPHDCTSSGYHARLWADGHVSLEHRTRWQGGRTGQRYVTDPGYIEVDVPQEVLEKRLAEIIPPGALVYDRVPSYELPHWNPFRRTARGIIVR